MVEPVAEQAMKPVEEKKPVVVVDVENPHHHFNTVVVVTTPIDEEPPPLPSSPPPMSLEVEVVEPEVVVKEEVMTKAEAAVSHEKDGNYFLEVNDDYTIMFYFWTFSKLWTRYGICLESWL
jgi:galactose mutarotase-like enzyme